MICTRTALAAALTLAAVSTATAQTYYSTGPVYVETSPGVYAPAAPAYYPPTTYYAPASVTYAPAYPPAGAPAVTQRNPRLYRTLEVLSEPRLLFRPTPYPGYTPTTRPFLDAAPNIASLALTGLWIAGNTPLGGYSLLVRPAIRTVRIALYGPPYPMTRRETRLWVVSPTLVQASRNRAATGYFFPALHQPGGLLGR